MNKIEKQNLANKFFELYNSSDWVFLINYVGLKAQSTLSIRSDLRKVGAKMSVVKNNINKIAFSKTKFSNLNEYLEKQVAVIYGGDPVSISKIIKKYVADDKKISAIISSDGKNLYDDLAINKLADLPSIDILRATLLGTLSSPASSLVRLLQEPSSSLVRVCNAKS